MSDVSTLLGDGVVADVTREAFAVMLGCELYEVAAEDAAPSVATSLVHITGVAECTVQLSFSEGMGPKLAATMFDMDEADVDDESLADALGELANVIGGGVKALLPAPSQLSLPMVTLDVHAPLLPTAVLTERIAFFDGSQHLIVTVWQPAAD